MGRTSTNTASPRLRSTVIVLLAVLVTLHTSPCNGVTAEPPADIENGTPSLAKVVVHYHTGKTQAAPDQRERLLLDTETVRTSLRNPRVVQIRPMRDLRINVYCTQGSAIPLNMEGKALDRMLLAAYKEEFPDFLPEVCCLTIWDDFGSYAGVAMGTDFIEVANMAPFCADTFDVAEWLEEESMARNRSSVPRAFSPPQAPGRSCDICNNSSSTFVRPVRMDGNSLDRGGSMFSTLNAALL